jgi:hypothetical protein
MPEAADEREGAIEFIPNFRGTKRDRVSDRSDRNPEHE